MVYSKELIEMLEKKARTLRRDVVISVGIGVAGHIGGSNSSADIVAALYFYKLRHDPKNPHRRDRDRFLLSPIPRNWGLICRDIRTSLRHLV